MLLFHKRLKGCSATILVMIICTHCGTVADMYKVDKKVEKLSELQIENFNICENCFEIIEAACERCNGAVFIPYSKINSSFEPDICPDCRNTILQETGSDPGWKLESKQNTFTE
jgi:hypothetical protein